MWYTGLQANTILTSLFVFTMQGVLYWPGLIHVTLLLDVIV